MLLMIGPFVWMLLGAFKTNADFVRTTPTLLPERWTLDNFSRLFSKQDFLRYFLNSAGIAVVVTAANLLFCSHGRLRAGQAALRRPPAADGAHAGDADGARHA